MTIKLWDTLLTLKERVYQANGPILKICIHLQDITINPKGICKEGGVLILLEPSSKSNYQGSIIYVNPNGFLDIQQIYPGHETHIPLFQLYLPFCLAPILTQQRKKALSIAHFAQSLDGHIATLTNQSKWIGNDENLVHAHRLRALVDAVVIGNNTLLEDQPRLTVRHVRGKHPVKVVIGNKSHSHASLLTGDTKVIRISSQLDWSEQGLDHIHLETNGKGICTAQILEALHQRGIYSVLVEGGSRTSSGFLQDRNLDMVQLHISPLLFGSGIKTFNLPTIDKVDECCSFERHLYHPVGDAMMFTGFLGHD